MKKHLLFLLIFILAVSLRLYQFSQIPSGINRDEAALGYNAYSILKTGKDEHSRFLPLSFESFGDWKQPIYIYLTIPFIFLFGLSAVSVKLPALLAALSMIPAIYILLQKMFPQTNHTRFAAAIGALLLTINPWHFHFSRQALEAIVATSFLTWATAFLTNQKTNTVKTLVGFILLFLSLFTYHGSLIIVPLWFILLWLFFFTNLKRSKIAITLSIVFVGFTYFLFYHTFFSPEQVKAQGLVIFDLSNEEKIQLIYSKRDGSLASLLIHNQPVYYSRQFINHYLQTFTPQFLFTQGGSHANYNVPGFGNFFWPEIVLAFLGLIWCLKLKSRSSLFLLSWVLIAPFPAAITIHAIHSTREVFLLPSIQLMGALGVIFALTITKIKPQHFLAVFCLIVAYASWPFYSYYFTDYKAVSDNFFHGYFKQLALDVDSLKSNYSQVIFDNPNESPYIFYAFYTKLDPQIFHQTVEFYDKDFEGFRHVKKLNGFQFRVIDWDIIATSRRPLPNDLIIMRYEKLHNWMQPKQTWDNLCGEPMLASIELKPI